jgi:WD40 repeat protein
VPAAKEPFSNEILVAEPTTMIPVVMTETPAATEEVLAPAPGLKEMPKHQSFFDRILPRKNKPAPTTPATGKGRCLRTLKGHSGSVSSAVFSHDSRWVASASDDRTVKIWDADTGRFLRTLKGHSGGVSSIVFSHDSRWVASASGDRTVKIWDVV